MPVKPISSDSTDVNAVSVPAPLLDWDGAAAMLGVSPRMVKELWARRQLSGVKIGKYVRFSEVDLDRYITAHHVEAER